MSTLITARRAAASAAASVVSDMGEVGDGEEERRVKRGVKRRVEERQQQAERPEGASKAHQARACKLPSTALVRGTFIQGGSSAKRALGQRGGE